MSGNRIGGLNITDVARAAEPFLLQMVKNSPASAAGLLNKIILIPSGTGDPSVYPKTAAGMTSALAAAASGDQIYRPSGTISGNHTIASGVEVIGFGENSKFSGTITNNGILTNCNVTGTLAGSGANRWVTTTTGLETNALPVITKSGVALVMIVGQNEFRQVKISGSGQPDLVLRNKDTNNGTLFRVSPNGSVSDPANEPPSNMQIFNTDWSADSTNFESFELRFLNNVAQLYGNKGGTGTGRAVQITTGQGVTFDNGLWIDPTNSYLSINKGSAAAQPLEVSGNVKITDAFLEVDEISAPASPAADHLRIYAKDVTGTTKLFYKRSDGTEVELGTISSGGGTTKISETTVGAGGAASVTFSSIASSYSHLMLVIQGRGERAATEDNFDVQFNGDSSAVYDFQYHVSFGTSTAAANLIDQTKGWIGSVPGASAPAGQAGQMTVMINNYKGTTFHKTWYSQITNRLNTGTGNLRLVNISGFWRSTAAISSIAVIGRNADIAEGTVLTLYGLN